MSNGALTVLDIFKLTPKTNCGKCGAPACMAFSAMVLSGLRKATDCPFLDQTQVDTISQNASRPEPELPTQDERIEALKEKVSAMNLAEQTSRLGATMSGNRLSILCLGRIFEVDNRGEMYSNCHVNPWIHLALLNYIVNCRGLSPAGNWVKFRELKNAGNWERFFNHRCENAMHRLADEYTDLFLDVLDLFGKKFEDDTTDADHSVVMHPMPRVPFLIRYWERDGELESKLSLFFDSTIDDNLAAEATFMLGNGISSMFDKIISKHSLETE